jgi:hypothetical protein
VVTTTKGWNYPYWPTVIIFTMLSPHISHPNSLSTLLAHIHTYIYIYIHIFIYIYKDITTCPHSVTNSLSDTTGYPIPSVEWGLLPHFQTHQPSCSWLIIIYIYFTMTYLYYIPTFVGYLFMCLCIYSLIYLFIYIYIYVYKYKSWD